MQEKSPLASEVIKLRIIKDNNKLMQMHLDVITKDYVGTCCNLQRSKQVETRFQGCDMGLNC
jgi:hypothetical protein